MSWSADQITVQLSKDPAVPELVVANPLLSQLARLRRRRLAYDAGFPEDRSRLLLQPRRLRRHDSFRGTSSFRAYARLDQWLRRRAYESGGQPPVLVSCHPVLAAVADRSSWADVVYYGWGDWLSYPPFVPLTRSSRSATRRWPLET